MARKQKTNWTAIAGIAGGFAGLGIGSAVAFKAYKKRKDESIVFEVNGDVTDEFTITINPCSSTEGEQVVKQVKLKANGSSTIRVHTKYNPGFITIQMLGSSSITLHSVTRKGGSLMTGANVTAYMGAPSAESSTMTGVFKMNGLIGGGGSLTIDCSSTCV